MCLCIKEPSLHSEVEAVFHLTMKSIIFSSNVADRSERPTIKLLLHHPNHILQVGYHPPAVIYSGLFKTSLFFDQIWLQLHVFPASHLWHSVLCFQLVCCFHVA